MTDLTLLVEMHQMYKCSKFYFIFLQVSALIFSFFQDIVFVSPVIQLYFELLEATFATWGFITAVLFSSAHGDFSKYTKCEEKT